MQEDHAGRRLNGSGHPTPTLPRPDLPAYGFLLSHGAPGEIRTPDPQIRSLVLYPAELRARLPSPGEKPRPNGAIAIGSVPGWQARGRESSLLFSAHVTPSVARGETTIYAASRPRALTAA